MQRTISQVIQRLEDLKKIHGDIPVLLQTSGGLSEDLSLRVDTVEDWQDFITAYFPAGTKYVEVFHWEDEDWEN